MFRSYRPPRGLVSMALAASLMLMPMSRLDASDPDGAKPSIWTKLFNKKSQPRDGGILEKLSRKVAQLKSQRQLMARNGGDQREIARLDARIDGFQRIRDLIDRRQKAVAAGAPRSQIAAIDTHILHSRRIMRLQSAAASICFFNLPHDCGLVNLATFRICR